MSIEKKVGIENCLHRVIKNSFLNFKTSTVNSMVEFSLLFKYDLDGAPWCGERLAP